MTSRKQILRILILILTIIAAIVGGSIYFFSNNLNIQTSATGDHSQIQAGNGNIRGDLVNGNKNVFVDSNQVESDQIGQAYTDSTTTIQTFRVASTREDLCVPGSYSAPTVEELTFDKQLFRDGFVMYLRQALNAYLANSYTACEGNNCYGGLVDGIHYRDSAAADLDELESINTDYLQSKFVVLQTDKAAGGGESIVLVFKNRPDTLFYAWVYSYDGRGYDLRGFDIYDQAGYGAPNIKVVQRNYINQLCNEALGV